MKLFDVSQSVLDAVKNAMVESPACYGKAKGCKCKKCKPVVKEEAEVLDERNKENKFKKDLHVAQKGKEFFNTPIKDIDHEKMANEYGHTQDQKRDTMKTLLKIYKGIGRSNLKNAKTTKEEVEQVDELKKSTLASYIGGASADKSALAHDIGKINQIAADTGTSAKDRAERDALSKKHGLRSLGINRAANKLAKEETVLETDDGWYAHREIHGSSGISAADWKKGWRLNKDGKRVQVKKEEVEQVDEVSASTLKSYNNKAGDKISRNIWKAEGGYPLSAKDRKSDDKRSKGMDMADAKLGGWAKVNAKEEVEVAEGDGSTVGSTPLKTKGKYVSADGRHVAKIRRDADWNEYRVEIHSDGKNHKPADYHTDDKEDAHDTAKAMLAHAVKHAKPLGEEAVAEGFEAGKVYHIGKDDRSYFIPSGEVQKNGKHKGLQFDGGAAGRSSKKPTPASYDHGLQWKKTPDEEIPSHVRAHLKEETGLVSKIINKYNK